MAIILLNQWCTPALSIQFLGWQQAALSLNIPSTALSCKHSTERLPGIISIYTFI